MVARGRFGGSLFRDMLTIDCNFPIGLSLRVDLDAIATKGGRAGANYARKRLRSGRGADGALPTPKDGGTPGQRTGKLFRSIKFDLHAGLIMPNPRGRRDVSARARSNFGLMAILIAEHD